MFNFSLFLSLALFFLQHYLIYFHLTSEKRSALALICMRTEILTPFFLAHSSRIWTMRDVWRPESEGCNRLLRVRNGAAVAVAVAAPPNNNRR